LAVDLGVDARKSLTAGQLTKFLLGVLLTGSFGTFQMSYNKV